VIADQTARRVVRSAAIWGGVFALYVVASAAGYASTYPTAAERLRLATTFGSNVGLNALIGPAHELQTVAGFTAWRSLGVLSIVGGVWGLLVGTRFLRGEEDAGRWEILLAGRVNRRGGALQVVVALGLGIVTLWAIPAAATVVVGRAASIQISVPQALYLALALVCSAAVFAMVGALASQVAATRRQATTYASAVLGVAYVLRMVADSGTGLAWLRWTTPLGWVEELRPLVGPRPYVLLPIVALSLTLASLTVFFAGVRDVGAGLVRDHVTAAPRLRLLHGPTGLGVRLGMATLVSWIVGVSTLGLVLGLVAKSAGVALTTSPSAERWIHRLGAPGAGAEAYLGVAFLVVALVVSLVAAGQVVAARTEEAHGRLDAFLVRSVTRLWWFAGRVAVAVGALLAVALCGGVLCWVGTASPGSGVALPRLLAAALNVIPPAAVVLGFGLLAFGAWPRSSSVVVYGVIAWSFLVELVGGLLDANHWLLDTSVFHHLAASPAVDVDWETDALLLLVGLVCGLIGAAAFLHRDLAGE
jgi:ABC-2 type transport system permease protein